MLGNISQKLFCWISDSSGKSYLFSSILHPRPAPQVHLPSQLSHLSGFWRTALMIQDICVSGKPVFRKRCWTSCIRAVRSRAPTSSPAPHSQCAWMEKVQKSLQYFLKSSGVTAQVQSNGNTREITPMLPENVKLPAQSWRTCSALGWGPGAEHPVCRGCPSSSQVAPAALLMVSFWWFYLFKNLLLFIA